MTTPSPGISPLRQRMMDDMRMRRLAPTTPTLWRSSLTIGGALSQQTLIIGASMKFDWHRDPINRATKIDETYKNTQNVRRFLTSECGEAFGFDRSFMAWIKSGAPKNMGEVADEWTRLRKVDVEI